MSPLRGRPARASRSPFKSGRRDPAPRTVGIIGVGKMGGAIARGLADRWKVLLCDRGETEIEGIGKAVTDPDAIIAQADAIVIAVKPQSFDELCRSITANTEGKIVISIMAGVRLSRLEERFPRADLVRSMPNLGAQVRRGLTAWIAGPGVSDERKEMVRGIFSAIGQQMEIENEDRIDAFTAIAGSGPAYFFELCRLLEEKAKEMGFTDADASLLARETFIASAELLKGDARSAEEWRQAVASKGGTTEAALNHLTSKAFDRIFFEAVEAARRRSRELSQ